MGTKLYVGNLNFNTTAEALRGAFEADGRTVAEVSIITDRETGRPRGFAFVEMGSDAEAAAAITALDGKELEGRTLRVNEAQAKTGGGGGFGGGGGGRGGGGRGGGFGGGGRGGGGGFGGGGRGGGGGGGFGFRGGGRSSGGGRGQVTVTEVITSISRTSLVAQASLPASVRRTASARPNSRFEPVYAHRAYRAGGGALRRGWNGSNKRFEALYAYLAILADRGAVAATREGAGEFQDRKAAAPVRPYGLAALHF